MDALSDRDEVILTFDANISDPDLEFQLMSLSDQLQHYFSGDKAVSVTKVEPWNSVRVTINISKEAAINLRRLAMENGQLLRRLGILSVCLENGQSVSLAAAADKESPSGCIVANPSMSISGDLVPGFSDSRSCNNGAASGRIGAGQEIVDAARDDGLFSVASTSWNHFTGLLKSEPLSYSYPQESLVSTSTSYNHFDVSGTKFPLGENPKSSYLYYSDRVSDNVSSNKSIWYHPLSVSTNPHQKSTLRAKTRHPKTFVNQDGCVPNANAVYSELNLQGMQKIRTARSGRNFYRQLQDLPDSSLTRWVGGRREAEATRWSQSAHHALMPATDVGYMHGADWTEESGRRSKTSQRRASRVKSSDAPPKVRNVGRRKQRNFSVDSCTADHPSKKHSADDGRDLISADRTDSSRFFGLPEQQEITKKSRQKPFFTDLIPMEPPMIEPKWIPFKGFHSEAEKARADAAGRRQKELCSSSDLSAFSPASLEDLCNAEDTTTNTCSSPVAARPGLRNLAIERVLNLLSDTEDDVTVAHVKNENSCGVFENGKSGSCSQAIYSNQNTRMSSFFTKDTRADFIPSKEILPLDKLNRLSRHVGKTKIADEILVDKQFVRIPSQLNEDYAKSKHDGVFDGCSSDATYVGSQWISSPHVRSRPPSCVVGTNACHNPLRLNNDFVDLPARSPVFSSSPISALSHSPRRPHFCSPLSPFSLTSSPMTDVYHKKKCRLLPHDEVADLNAADCLQGLSSPRDVQAWTELDLCGSIPDSGIASNISSGGSDLSELERTIGGSRECFSKCHDGAGERSRNKSNSSSNNDCDVTERWSAGSSKPMGSGNSVNDVNSLGHEPSVIPNAWQRKNETMSEFSSHLDYCQSQPSQGMFSSHRNQTSQQMESLCIEQHMKSQRSSAVAVRSNQQLRTARSEPQSSTSSDLFSKTDLKPRLAESDRTSSIRCEPSITCPSLPHRLSESIKLVMQGIPQSVSSVDAIQTTSSTNEDPSSSSTENNRPSTVIRIMKTKSGFRSNLKETWCIQPVFRHSDALRNQQVTARDKDSRTSSTSGFAASRPSANEMQPQSGASVRSFPNATGCSKASGCDKPLGLKFTSNRKVIIDVENSMRKRKQESDCLSFGAIRHRVWLKSQRKDARQNAALAGYRHSSEDGIQNCGRRKSANV